MHSYELIPKYFSHLVKLMAFLKFILYIEKKIKMIYFNSFNILELNYLLNQ